MCNIEARDEAGQTAQADAKPQPTDTLMRALDKLRAGRWADHRSKDVLYSQGRTAADHLTEIILATLEPERHVLVKEVTSGHVAVAIRGWQGAQIAPDTIRKRLNVLRAMGVDLGKAEDRPKLSKKVPPKWWLSLEEETRVCNFLRQQAPHRPYCMPTGAALMLANYIRFVTRSGLRVEEALRITPNAIKYSSSGPAREVASIMVDGTKTLGSRATLPLMPEAYDALLHAWHDRHGLTPEVAMLDNLRWAASHPHFSKVPVFQFGLSPEASYLIAAQSWEKCRAYLGASDNPTATLKALRRSAARYLHITKGMPLDMVREYLRHEDIETTQGYLRLTGGYGEAEMRKWLTKDP